MMDMSTQNTVKCGWVQVNNTVVPHVMRCLANDMPTLLVPLPVIRCGAGLLCNDHVLSLMATDVECEALNKACLSAGLDFAFDSCLDLVPLYDVVKKNRTTMISFLPENDPFGNSDFKPEVCHNAIIKKRPDHNAIIKKCPDLVSDDEYEAMDLSIGANPAEMCTGTQEIPSSPDYKEIQKHCDATEMPLDLSQATVVNKQTPDVEILSSYIPPKKTKKDQMQNLLMMTPSNSVYVRPVKMHQRTIPCIIKARIPYVLVETIRKAYFPQCSLRAFMFIVERCVSPFIYDMDKEDIATIMRFAANPTSLLKCSKVISVRDANQMLPMIKKFLVRVEQQRQRRRNMTKGERSKHNSRDDLGSLAKQYLPSNLGTRGQPINIDHLNMVGHQSMLSGSKAQHIPSGLTDKYTTSNKNSRYQPKSISGINSSRSQTPCNLSASTPGTLTNSFENNNEKRAETRNNISQEASNSSTTSTAEHDRTHSCSVIQTVMCSSQSGFKTVDNCYSRDSPTCSNDKNTETFSETGKDSLACTSDLKSVTQKSGQSTDTPAAQTIATEDTLDGLLFADSAGNNSRVPSAEQTILANSGKVWPSSSSLRTARLACQ